VILLAGIFLMRFSHLQLASDDLDWLAGRAPTVFDAYRLIPRLFFQGLNALFGPNPMAALGMSFLFHATNIILIYLISKQLFSGKTGPLVAAWVFGINPLTLSTLTWFSCFSYILGTTFGLCALLFALKSYLPKASLFWLPLAYISYIFSLFSSHELLFLPVLFLVWGVYKSKLNRSSLLLFALSVLSGLAVNQWYYRFTDLQVNPGALFSTRFLLAGISSVVSFGSALTIVYFPSFFAGQITSLQLLFSEPWRWWLTALAGALVMFALNRQSWRKIFMVLLSFSALIAPYILRLFLMPPGVSYSPEYVLSGRVFYIPFVMLAIGFGMASNRIESTNPRWTLRILIFLGGLAYAWAILSYQPSDFLGLSVMKSESAVPIISSENWNPFHSVTSAGLTWLLLTILISMGLRFFLFQRIRLISGSKK
jgi:hypothetical protein